MLPSASRPTGCTRSAATAAIASSPRSWPGSARRPEPVHPSIAPSPTSGDVRSTARSRRPAVPPTRPTPPPTAARSLSRPEGDVPVDRRRRRVDADESRPDRVPEMSAEGRVLIEELPDQRPEHLRHGLARRIRGTAPRGTGAESAGELGRELVQLGAQLGGSRQVGEALGLVELRAELVEARAIRPSGSLVRSVVEGAGRQSDREALLRG